MDKNADIKIFQKRCFAKMTKKIRVSYEKTMTS